MTDTSRAGAGDGFRGQRGQPVVEDRSARKRRVVMEAATALFLRHGYLGTSMDQIAAFAAVSKPTVYKFFPDKERLFTEIVLATLDRVGGPIRAELSSLAVVPFTKRDGNGVGARFEAHDPRARQQARALLRGHARQRFDQVFGGDNPGRRHLEGRERLDVRLARSHCGAIHNAQACDAIGTAVFG